MRKTLCWTSFAALLFGIGGSSLLLAQTPRDLTPELTEAYQTGQAKPGSLAVMALLDRADATYAVGESIRLAVKTNEDAYVTVLNIGASGRVTQLFPNRFQMDNHVKAGEPLDVPSAASGARIRVTGQTGTELIKVIASAKPLVLVPEDQMKANGSPFSTLEGGVLALKRDLDVVSSNPAPEAKIAIVNQVIRTVPARTSMSDASNGTVPGAEAEALLPVTTVPAQNVPLLLATDKLTYKVGEPLTMAVTSLQPCHLRVVERDGRARARLLFPSAALPSDQIAALQTIMISGGPSPQTVIAAAPGPERIVAYCTDEAPSASLPLRTAAEFLNEDDKGALDRSLAVVANRPSKPTGFAQISLTIVP